MRQSREKKVNYNYPKYGTSGVFSSDSSQPIEYVLTSLPINEINDLSFARDINEDSKNFDYLIQRDIDEDRARKEICTYLTSASNNKTFFLPPLIVAVVGVDKDDNLKEHFPNMNVVKSDKQIVREWNGLFKVTNYFDEDKGVNLKLLPDELVNNIDLEQVFFEMNLPSSGAGGRLVVIDGQHRLFALKHLYDHERDKVKGITVPVCFVYSPLSTIENIESNPEIVDVPTTLRKLFVDVNSTVEKVSGHFLTLLSDDNFGSIVCREFCSTIYNEIGGNALSLIEWNTKNYKESKTISRVHSITSIGLLNDALYDYLGSSKAKLSTLEYLLDFDLSSYNIENADELISQNDIPWSGYNVEMKNDLKIKAKSNIVDFLKRIFFEPDVYVENVKTFDRLLNEKLVEIREERDTFSDCYSYLKSYYLFNDPIPDSKGIKSKCKTLQTKLNQWFQEERYHNSNPIAYTTVYQKGLISSWIELSYLCGKIGLGKPESTTILINLMNATLKSEMNFFEYTQPYMQDNLYSGSRIRATKRTSEQIKLLTFSMLGNDIFMEGLQAELALTAEQKRSLIEIGKESSSLFFEKLRVEKQKVFAKNYKHNFSLTEEDKKKLSLAEEQRNTQISSSTDSSNKVDAAINFDELIRSMVKNDLINSAKILASKIGYEDFFYLVDINEQE
ncbi:hypothetical protein [Vibrio splendidus]|uniref:hypothetical protein n=1 Tax=Vibrio splendidus TaxID=29497 RepID=UPI001C077527|nr:hypothetical protein [Vibrio splendidus]MBU2908526.1 hypothetical protein [Vibrio splendidus]MDO6531686.1 hypothetical protein [Vibrio splendidus]MDO6552783.1 hypothetical protein [Vibrio splendidus]